MKKLKHITETCKEIYETKGQTAVFDYINSLKPVSLKNMGVSYKRCDACETSSPSWGNQCLVCGQETRNNLSQKEELIVCAELLVWTLKNENENKKSTLDRIKRLKQLAS